MSKNGIAFLFILISLHASLTSAQETRCGKALRKAFSQAYGKVKNDIFEIWARSEAGIDTQGERTLLEQTIENAKPFPGASAPIDSKMSEANFEQLDSGHRILFKTLDDDKISDEFCWKAEVATFRLDELLEANLTAPAYPKKLPVTDVAGTTTLKEGAALLVVDAPTVQKLGKKFLAQARANPNFAFFSFLVNNIDGGYSGSANNLLYSKSKSRFIGVDNVLAFSGNRALLTSMHYLRHPKSIAEIIPDKRILNHFMNLTDEQLQSNLHSLLSEHAFKEFLVRWTFLKSRILMYQKNPRSFGKDYDLLKDFYQSVGLDYKSIYELEKMNEEDLFNSW
jgi:hypothetical protein